MCKLALFIAGETAKSQKAVSDLDASLYSKLGGKYTLEVIDLVENPEIAHQESVIPTPTLIKRPPGA